LTLVLVMYLDGLSARRQSSHPSINHLTASRQTVELPTLRLQVQRPIVILPSHRCCWKEMVARLRNRSIHS